MLSLLAQKRKRKSQTNELDYVVQEHASLNASTRSMPLVLVPLSPRHRRIAVKDDGAGDEGEGEGKRARAEATHSSTLATKAPQAERVGPLQTH